MRAIIRIFKIGLYLFISFACFFVGSLFLLFPWAESLRLWFIHNVIEDLPSVLLIGGIFVLLGIILVMVTVSVARRRSLVIAKGPATLVLEQTIFEDYLQHYWKRLFPKGHVVQQIRLKRNKIKIRVEFPHIPEDQQADIVNKMQLDLDDLIRNTIGFQGEVDLQYAFASA